MIKKLVVILIIATNMTTNNIIILEQNYQTNIRKICPLQLNTKKEENFELQNKILQQWKQLKEIQNIKEYGKTFLITFYDLSFESCGKLPNHFQYGITATGISLKQQTWETIRAVSVDPSVIPLNSYIDIVFENQFNYLNGQYKAVDTGSAIKGYHLDLYISEVMPKIYDEIGITSAKVRY